MHTPVVAFAVLHWVEYCTVSEISSDNFTNQATNMVVDISFSAYLNFVPLFYDLIVQASHNDLGSMTGSSTLLNHKKCVHPYAFKVLCSVISKLMASNTSTFNSEFMENNNELVQKLVRDGFEAVIYLMSLGYCLAPLQFIIDSVESLDADVVRYIVSTILSSMKHPYSVIFLNKMYLLLSRDSVMKALSKKDNFSLLIQFEQEVMKGLSTYSIDSLLGEPENEDDEKSIKYQEVASKIQSLVLMCKSSFKY